MRLLREIVIQVVLAGALTGLVLGYLVIGGILGVVGAVMVYATQQGEPIVAFCRNRLTRLAR